MMPSVAKIKFIKTNVNFRYHTKDVSDQVSYIRVTKSKVTQVQIPVPKWEKTKKSEKRLSGLQNGAIRGLQIEAGFRDYKSRQDGLQIGAKRFQIGVEITSQCKRDFKSGQGLQIGAKQLQ